MNNPKFGVLELNGEEFQQPVEYEPIAEDIFYDANKVQTVKGFIDMIDKGKFPKLYKIWSLGDYEENKSFSVIDGGDLPFPLQGIIIDLGEL